MMAQKKVPILSNDESLHENYYGPDEIPKPMKDPASTDKYEEFILELKKFLQIEINNTMRENTKDVAAAIIEALDPIIDRKIDRAMGRLTNSLRKAIPE